DQVDADQRDANVGVNDDALVENPVQNIDETRASRGSFNGHFVSPVAGAVPLMPSSYPSIRSDPASPAERRGARSASSSVRRRLPVRHSADPFATSSSRSPPPCRSSRQAGGSGSSGARRSRG